MGEGDVAAALREAVLVMLKLGGPPLLAALCVGLAVSLVQAATQINESTLAFVPKVIATGAVLALTGSFMVTTLTDYAHHMFDQIVVVGGL